MGRHRDISEPGYFTVTEAAERLGVTPQAIYNRIKANTIPHREHIDEATSRPSYRIPGDWLDREVQRKASSNPASSAEVIHETEMRATEIIAAVGEMFEQVFADSDDRLLSGVAGLLEENRRMAGEFFPALFAEITEAIELQKAEVKGAIEEQVRQVVPRLDALLEALEENAGRQRRMLGWLEELKNSENEEYKLLRQVVARAEEEDRREREWQRKNYELNERIAANQEENLAILREAREEATKAREERERLGLTERRSWWRKLFRP